MKEVMLREWKDLTVDEQNKAKEAETNAFIESELEFLTDDLNAERIAEDEYYREIGCAKHCAETTAWFIPSCYYEKHKVDVDYAVETRLQSSLYDAFGRSVYL